MIMDNRELVDLIRELQLENANLKIRLEEYSRQGFQPSRLEFAESQRLSKTGNWYWDIKTGHVEWTEEVYKIFHLDPKVFIPTINSILDFSPWPEDHQRDQELIRRAINNREPGEYEQRFLRSDGSIGYYYSTFQGVYSESGELTAIIGIVQDITDRKKAEKSLEKEILLLRTLINHLPSSIFVLDNQYRKTICNEAHLKRIEKTLDTQRVVTEANIIGKTNWDVYPKALADKYFEEDRKEIEDGETIIEKEIFQIDQYGNSVWETISKIPMRDADGLIVGMVGIAHDITKNKLGEMALQESEERYRFLFEKNPAPMLIYEHSTLRILAINEAFLTNYGYKKSEVLDMVIPDLYPEDEKELIIQLHCWCVNF